MWEEADAKGNLEGTYKLGHLCYKQGDKAKAQRLFEKAHADGDEDATIILAELCFAQGELANGLGLLYNAQASGCEKATGMLQEVDHVLANGDGALLHIYAELLEHRFRLDVQRSYVPELQQEQSLFPQVCDGARVKIHGLKSQAGLLLNGRNGSVVQQLSSERFAIDIDGGMGVKSLKQINLMMLSAFQEEGYFATAPNENAQVSNAILRQLQT